MYTNDTNPATVYRTPFIPRAGMFPGITFFPANEDEGSGDDASESDDDSEEAKPYKQSEIDAQIAAAVGRNSKKHEKELNTLRKQLEELTKAPKDSKKPDGEVMPLSEFTRQKSEWETAKGSEIDGYKKTISNLLGAKKNSEILEACSRQNLVPDGASIVSRLIADDLAFDEDGNIYVRKAGSDEPRYDGAKPMTVAAYVDEFLKGKDYLKLAGAQGGGGSKPNGGKTGSEDLSKLTPAEKIARGMSQRNEGN